MTAIAKRKQGAELSLTETNRGLWPETDAACCVGMHEADERGADDQIEIGRMESGAVETSEMFAHLVCRDAAHQ